MSSLGNAYLSFDNTVYDGIQGFIRIALDHALNKARASADSLLHGHVQVVVGLLGGKVLPWSKQTDLSVFAGVSRQHYDV